MSALQSPLLSKIANIEHGFGDRSDPVAAHMLSLWQRERPIFEQVHGSQISKVERLQQKLGPCDGMFTELNSPIGVVSADCVPILLARLDGSKVGAVHAGWKGTIARIVAAFAQTADPTGKLNNWVAAIGPSIGACCYKVDTERVQTFKKAFPEIQPSEISPTGQNLDLPMINACELERLGIKDIDFLDDCTYCTHDSNGKSRFHSYRREGGGTRQYSIIRKS